MTDYTLYLPASYQSGFVTVSGAIWTRIGTNPGSTIAELATALGYSEAITTQALDTIEAQRIVVRRYNASGNSGQDVSKLATDLSVAYGIATGLAEALVAEGCCKILYS